MHWGRQYCDLISILSFFRNKNIRWNLKKLSLMSPNSVDLTAFFKFKIICFALHLAFLLPIWKTSYNRHYMSCSMLALGVRIVSIYNIFLVFNIRCKFYEIISCTLIKMVAQEPANLTARQHVSIHIYIVQKHPTV